MTLLLAAVGAVVTALLELTVVPYLRIGDAQPHLVLVLGVVVDDRGRSRSRSGLGLRRGASRSMSLHNDHSARPRSRCLLCVGGASILARSFARLRPIVPIGAVFVLSLGYSMILFVTFSALGTPLPVADPLGTVLPSAVYDAVLAAIVGPLDDRRA